MNLVTEVWEENTGMRAYCNPGTNVSNGYKRSGWKFLGLKIEDIEEPKKKVTKWQWLCKHRKTNDIWITADHYSALEFESSLQTEDNDVLYRIPESAKEFEE